MSGIGGWLAQNWLFIFSLFGSAGIGGVGSRLARHWWDNQRARRKQTDDVALGLVQTLSARITALEAGRESDRIMLEQERALGHANLELVRKELHNVEGAFDALLLALKHAPAERHQAIVEEVTAWREARANQVATRGKLAGEVQTVLSAGRIVRDVLNPGSND